MLAGRPHEAAGNGSPRWMAAGPRERVHRTRPTGQLARRPNKADVAGYDLPEGERRVQAPMPGSRPRMLSIRRLAISSRPTMHLAYTARRTSTPWSAHIATWVGSTPAFSQVDTAAWRRS